MHLISLHDKRQTALLRTRTPQSFVRYSGKMGRGTERTDRKDGRTRRERERERERGNILMTKYEMTLASVERKAGTNERRMDGGTAAAGRLWDPPIDRMGTDDDATMSTPPEMSLSRSVICYAN